MLIIRRLLILALALLPTVSQAANDPSDKLAQAKASVVKVIVSLDDPSTLQGLAEQATSPKKAKALVKQVLNALSKDDKTVSIGSGVVVSKEERSAYVATSVPVEKFGRLYVRGSDATGNDEVEFAFKDEGKGLYFLKYKVVRDSLKPIAMVESNKEYREKNLGTKVYLIGYPGSAEISSISAKEATVSASTISALNKVDAANTALIQTDHFIQQGAQGGALINEEGELIGVVRKEINNESIIITLAQQILKAVSGAKVFGEVTDSPAQAFATPSDFAVDILKTKNVGGFQYRKVADTPVAAAPATAEAPKAAPAKLPEPLVPAKSDNTLLWILGLAGVLLAGAAAYFFTRGQSGSPTAAASSPSSAPASGGSFVLKYVGGDSTLQGKQWPVTREGATVGRSGEIQLNSKEASNNHAKFFLEAGSPMVEHLSSTNSTLVNNNPITGRVRLKAGDKIQVAKGGVDIFVVESR